MRDKNRPRTAWELVWSDECDGDDLDDTKRMLVDYVRVCRQGN